MLYTRFQKIKTGKNRQNTVDDKKRLSEIAEIVGVEMEFFSLKTVILKFDREIFSVPLKLGAKCRLMNDIIGVSNHGVLL